MSTIKEDPFCHNHTFVIFFLFFDVFTFFPFFEYSGCTNWSRIPEYRILVTTVLSITLALICFMIVIKFVAWMLKRSKKGKKINEKYDKSSGKVDSYDKCQLLFGYYSMTFLTILLQVSIWWVDYDNDGCLRHFFLNIMLAIFITELQCVQNDRIVINDQEDSEDMENARDCSGMPINFHC
ncbi:hypothetical protein B9Z55_012483 [Caenorhabditis nigoni]|uniref:Uncharacterized protein n=1 Tax=Caenorhabditis nigoni TaxID=1611254 RepID=A0A2G5TXC5_9PELO|nr:hypothetical protein B9Z55_012483 [Caenorhabditis nigoni]